MQRYRSACDTSGIVSDASLQGHHTGGARCARCRITVYARSMQALGNERHQVRESMQGQIEKPRVCKVTCMIGCP